VLPDLLRPGLRLVVCGSAAGATSAAAGRYYAGRGNRFWKTLADVGLTPEILEPKAYKQLLDYGIGLTDIVKDQAGADVSIDFKTAGAALTLRTKIERFEPRVLCFNGKRGAQTFFDARTIGYGIQREAVGSTLLFVAPSTSAAASGSWSLETWKELAAHVDASSA
jgi:double-stranded uracil-DNA glycosylase